jgi:hypothetical protein
VKYDFSINLDDPKLLVVNDKLSYDPKSLEGLHNQSLTNYFKQYCAFHSLILPKLEGEGKATITTSGETHYDVKSKSMAKLV